MYSMISDQFGECRRPAAGPGLVCGTTLLLDQLGGIWEITMGVILPKALPTGLKRSL